MSLKTAIKRVLDPVTTGIFSIPLMPKVFDYFAYQKMRRDRRRIERRLREAGLYDYEVQFGPFKGMRYPEGWVSCGFQKIIGSYEAELHGVLGRIMNDPLYTAVINTGAAEGYFTVGLARAMPDADIYAYEMQEQCQTFIKELAELNGLKNRLDVSGKVTPEVLAEVEPGERPLVVCDVDSYEMKLLSPEAVPWLKRADILVELHDYMEAGISDAMRNRFSHTHDIELISSLGLKYENYPVLRTLSYDEMRMMIEEGRPALQDWFFMTVKRSRESCRTRKHGGHRVSPFQK